MCAPVATVGCNVGGDGDDGIGVVSAGNDAVFGVANSVAVGYGMQLARIVNGKCSVEIDVCDMKIFETQPGTWWKM